ncbi:hypothetical protein HY745_08360, partial [Candidatus Desantisbacteria bacterium]|nr:hypothetical protein [Candidatus Desantisbacteria bacterium]
PYVNGIRSIDSFTPIGQIRAIMFRACYDMLDVLRDYYNAPAENFLQIWGRLWDEDSYNIVRNSCNIYCSLQYSQKPVLEAISDLLNIYNGRLNFRIDSNFGKFYSDFYHPKMKSIFSITPKSLDQSNDYEKGVKYPAANRVKNSIKGYYMDSNILRNNGKENTKQKYEYTSDFSKKIFGIKSFGSDFDYSIDSDIVIDIGDLPYIDGMPIKTKRSEIHAAFNRKVGMLKSPPILYKFAINLKTIKINLGDLIIVSDKTGGMDDIELEVLNISYDPSGYKENAASCGTITAVKHGIGLEPGEVYIIETGNLFYNSKYVWY